MQNIRKYWIAIVLVFAVFLFVKPAVCPLILGSVLLYLTYITVPVLRRIAKAGVEGTGTILEYNVGSKGHKTPVIEFATPQGQLIRKTPFFYSSTDLSKIRSYEEMLGQPVAIVYDPEDPEKFVLKGETGFNNLVIGVLALFGTSLWILGISMLLGYIKAGF